MCAQTSRIGIHTSGHVTSVFAKSGYETIQKKKQRASSSKDLPFSSKIVDDTMFLAHIHHV